MSVIDALENNNSKHTLHEITELSVLDVLEKNRARRFIFVLLSIPLSLFVLGCIWMAINIGNSLLLISSMIGINVLTCIYNYIYIKGLSTDQLSSENHYIRLYSVSFLLSIFNFIGMGWLVIVWKSITIEQAVFFMILATLFISYFGFTLPIFAHRKWLELRLATSEYRTGMLASIKMRMDLLSKKDSRALSDEQITNYLREVDSVLRIILKDEYTRSRLDTTVNVYASAWMLNLLLCGLLIVIIYILM